MFTFPVDPAALFAERAVQMRAWGIPARTIEGVRGCVRDAWADAPGGWAFEWTRAGQEQERLERWLVAAACYGAARFPCAATELRERAVERQLDCYERAARKFPCHFERRTLHVPYRDGATPVKVHVFEPRQAREATERRWPIVVLSGGVDTFKIELHRLALVLAKRGEFTVAAIDLPGTGESQIPLAPDAEAIYLGVLERLRAARGGVFTPAAVVGLSFGGHFAAKIALKGGVDACVDVGGPVGAAPLDGAVLARLPNGMTGIVANALRLPALPNPADAANLLAGFSLREQGLFTCARLVPLLVVNGADDPYVPPEDVEVFRKLETATVWRLRDAGHCAAECLPRVVPAILAWLRLRLHGDSVKNRLLAKATQALLPNLVLA